MICRNVLQVRTLSLHMSQMVHQAGIYLLSMAWSNKEYFYFPLDGMLVYCRVTLSIKYAATHLYTWMERGTLRVKRLAQEHITMSLVRAWTQTTWSGVKCTNHKATTSPSVCSRTCNIYMTIYRNVVINIVCGFFLVYPFFFAGFVSGV